MLELEDKKILLGVANIWEPRKGLNTFNNIAQGISDEFQVILVGKIPAGVKIHSKIIVLDQVNSTEELRKIYSSAYIFINPTSVDNYPTTNLEASACGVPIITSSVGGTPETIQKGRGIIFQNFDDLLNKISFLGWFNENIEFDSKKIDKEVSFKKYLEVFERR
nr:glycosyltransferase [Enterococcus casseliflavus]